MKYHGKGAIRSICTIQSTIRGGTINDTQQFAIADPRSFDGDPFEVASRAVRQAEAVAAILATALDGAHVMARNAELERQLIANGDCDAVAWDESAQNQKWDSVEEAVAAVRKDLATLSKAAGFNPKAPLGRA